MCLQQLLTIGEDPNLSDETCEAASAVLFPEKATSVLQAKGL